jgi:hypothetical protein
LCGRPTPAKSRRRLATLQLRSCMTVLEDSDMVEADL